MKFVVAIIIAIYSIFVFIVGDASHKGMLLAVLVLLGLILLFYKYAYFVRRGLSKYEELKKAVSIADSLTSFIEKLEESKTLHGEKELEPGFTIDRVVGILKRSKFKSAVTTEQITKETETKKTKLKNLKFQLLNPQ